MNYLFAFLMLVVLLTVSIASRPKLNADEPFVIERKPFPVVVTPLERDVLDGTYDSGVQNVSNFN